MKRQYIQILPWVIICLLLIYIGQCTHRGKPKPAQIVTETDTLVTVDTVRSIRTVYKPKPFEVIRTDTFTIRDTVRFISYCSELKRYRLPISNDSNSKITVLANVQLNEIKDWTFEAEIYPRTTVIERNHVIVTPERNKLVAGLILSGNDAYFGAAPVFGLKTKKDNVMMFGYDVINGNYTFGYVMAFGKK